MIAARGHFATVQVERGTLGAALSVVGGHQMLPLAKLEDLVIRAHPGRRI